MVIARRLLLAVAVLLILEQLIAPTPILVVIAVAILVIVLITEWTGNRGQSANKADGETDNKKQFDIRAMYEVVSTLGATLDYNKVLQAALDVGVFGLREMGSSARMVGMVLLFKPGARSEELRIVTSRGLTHQDEKKPIAGMNGIIGQALKKAEPVFASQVQDDPELKYFAGFQDVQSLLVIPLHAGFENYGVLVYGTNQADAFSEEHIDLLTAIGTQATMALKNAVLYQNLLEEKERIVKVDEDARKKLARDLHDGPTQSVAAIAMRVNYIRRLIQVKPQDADDELQKVEELARRTTKEIRHMLFTLRPLALESAGLTQALQQLAEKMKENYSQNVIVQAQEGVDGLLEMQAQGTVFYIIEEAVGNARKHAQAQHIYVRLFRQNAYLMVEIQDDGVGFDVEATMREYKNKKDSSLGMVNLRERAALIEGTMNLDSAKGKGTKISVAIPLKGLPETQPEPAFQAPTPRPAVQQLQRQRS